jgi:hypothetical protein
MSLDQTIKPDDWRDVKIPAFLGLNKALDPDNLEMGELVRAENIRLVDDTIVPAVGFAAYHDTVNNGPWVGDAMTPFRYRLTDGTLGQLLFTTRGLYRDTGTIWTQIAGGTFSGDLNNRFSIVSVPWADVIVFTNGFDPVQVFNPATQVISNLPGPGGANIYARALAIFDSSLWLLNTVENGVVRPQRVRYTDKGNHTNFDTGVAGFRDLLDGTAPLMCARLLGTYLILYRERGIHRVDISVNALERFQIDNMIPDNGVVSIDSVINIEKNRHLVWGRDNFYLYDGGFELEAVGDPVSKVVFEPLLADSIGEDIMFSAEDIEAAHRHHLIYLESLGEILAVYKSLDTTDLEAALTFRYKEKRWFTRKFLNRPVRGADSANAFVHVAWDDLVGTWNDLVGSWDDLTGPFGSVFPIFASSLGGASGDTTTFQFNVDLITGFVGLGVAAVGATRTLETKDYSEYPFGARLDWVDLRIHAPQEVTMEFSIDEGVTWDILRAFTTTVLSTVRLHRQIAYESVRFRLTGLEYTLKSMNLRVTPEDEVGMTETQPTFTGPGAPVTSGALV